jgi:pimeloyl-ACP methyl ester carboxylesterase
VTAPAPLGRLIAESKQLAAQRERNSAALLPYVGTPNAARDLDVLRSTLGESQLTYLGKSCGTYLGAWYAQLFPHRVRALVLDGAVDPDTSSLQATIAQAQGFQRAFGSFAAWCLASPGCPLGPGGPVAGAAAKVEGLIAGANSVPLTDRLGDGQTADGAVLLTGVADALYSRSLWPALRTALASAFGATAPGSWCWPTSYTNAIPMGPTARWPMRSPPSTVWTGPGRGRWPRGDRPRQRPRRPRRRSVRPLSEAA